mmetsp:Transcript_50459/g.131092  ORF Transcript_50459/g.131092 Transcript_50459/m.131092 type:complete len:241 (+) Transcript_50459:576-1298(+)
MLRKPSAKTKEPGPTSRIRASSLPMSLSMCAVWPGRNCPTSSTSILLSPGMLSFLSFVLTLSLSSAFFAARFTGSDGREMKKPISRQQIQVVTTAQTTLSHCSGPKAADLLGGGGGGSTSLAASISSWVSSATAASGVGGRVGASVGGGVGGASVGGGAGSGAFVASMYGRRTRLRTGSSMPRGSVSSTVSGGWTRATTASLTVSLKVLMRVTGSPSWNIPRRPTDSVLLLAGAPCLRRV